MDNSPLFEIHCKNSKEKKKEGAFRQFRRKLHSIRSVTFCLFAKPNSIIDFVHRLILDFEIDPVRSRRVADSKKKKKKREIWSVKMVPRDCLWRFAFSLVIRLQVLVAGAPPFQISGTRNC